MELITLQPLHVPQILPRGVTLPSWTAVLLRELLEDLNEVENRMIEVDETEEATNAICTAVFCTLISARESSRASTTSRSLLAAAMAVYSDQRAERLPCGPVNAYAGVLTYDSKGKRVLDLRDLFMDCPQEYNRIVNRTASLSWQTITKTLSQLLP